MSLINFFLTKTRPTGKHNRRLSIGNPVHCATVFVEAMKARFESDTKPGRRLSFQSAAIAIIGLFCLGFLLHASGILIRDPDLRFVHQRHQVYRVKSFLHLSKRDHPHFNSAVGWFLGDDWSRKYCFAAHIERKGYEERMSRRTFALKYRTTNTKAFEPHWNQLKLEPYCRYWVSPRSEIIVVAPEEEMESVKQLIDSFDQQATASRADGTGDEGRNQ